MDQTTLIVALAVLIVILIVLSLSRIRKEKLQTALIRSLNNGGYSDLLKSNGLDGNIQAVASKVSEQLVNAFGCEKILFLRKRRSVLELNYYHGVSKFQRSDFRIPFSKNLSDALRTDFNPRQIDSIEKELPTHFYRNLSERGMGTFFPIFWRENLYGVYFIRPTVETSTESFALMIASVAQTLSAAYHIKWHEAKMETLKNQISDLRQAASSGSSSKELAGGAILKLLRHRNSQTIVPKIMDTLRKDLSLDRLVYLYQSSDELSEPVQLDLGLRQSLDVPDTGGFEKIIKALDGSRSVALDELGGRHAGIEGWASEQKAHGLTHATLFPITARRTGVLSWSGEAAPDLISNRLNGLRGHASDLVCNAEEYERIEQMSYTDELTGLANHRYFTKRLEEEASRAKRYNRCLALIFFDLDELKDTNTRFGHLAGDAILRQMGSILKMSIRAIDIVARYGGDEFCIIMPEADADTCVRFMDRLQQKIAGTTFALEGQPLGLSCTISLGGAIYPDHAQTTRDLIEAADQALLRAKESGRNKALIHPLQ